MITSYASTLPTMTIVTVCRNSAATILKTIDSVARQKSDGIEYVIVDGGSTDATMDIVRAHKGVDRFTSEPDSGIADAFNKGIRQATGAVIGLVNSDDQLASGAIATVRAYFQSHPDIDVIHGDVYLLDGEKCIKRLRPPAQWWCPWRLVLFNHPATFVRREVYERYGLFDTSYRIAMDVEIFFRWMIHQVNIAYLPEILVSMRSGGVSGQLAIRGFQEVRRAALQHGFNAFLVHLQYVGKLAVWSLLYTVGLIKQFAMSKECDKGPS